MATRPLRPLQLWISDRLYAAARRASGRRILVMRHTEQLPDYNDDLLAWLKRAAPRAAESVRAAPRRLRAEGPRALRALPPLAPGSSSRGVAGAIRQGQARRGRDPRRRRRGRESGGSALERDQVGGVGAPAGRRRADAEGRAHLARADAAGGIRVPGDRAGGPPSRRPDASVPRRARARERPLARAPRAGRRRVSRRAQPGRPVPEVALRGGGGERSAATSRDQPQMGREGAAARQERSSR